MTGHLPALLKMMSFGSPHTGGHLLAITDSTYISDQFTPQKNNSVTVWMPLDSVGLETGTLEYVEGSTDW